MEIPEQHDEQRLMGDGGKLGPPSGIFASPYLLEFRHPWQISAHPNPGVLVAFVVVLKEPGVAAVPQTYKNLKLDFGLNCIFLRPAATPSKYEAWVLNPPGNSPCRTSGGGGGTAQGPLEVKLDTTGIDWGDNIAAARFSEDLSNNSQPLLSIPCLKDWCEIGPAGFTPHRPTAPPDPLDPDRAGHRIKGWHDEQDLEVQNPFTGDWMPSGIRGTLVPDRALASRSTGVYRDVYLPVAKIYLDRMPAMASKLFLRGLRLGWNKVELTNDVTTAAGWQFRITAETNPTGRPPEIWKLSAPPHLHADAPVPATARWRFTVLDPGIWVMCGQYCCEADGLF